MWKVTLKAKHTGSVHLCTGLRLAVHSFAIMLIAEAQRGDNLVGVRPREMSN